MQLEHKSNNPKDRSDPGKGQRDDAIIAENKWHFDKPGCGTGRVTIFWKRQTLDLEAAGFTVDVQSDKICPDVTMKVLQEIDFYETDPDCLDVYDVLGSILELVSLGLFEKPSLPEEAKLIFNREVGAKVQSYVGGRCWRIP